MSSSPEEAFWHWPMVAHVRLSNRPRHWLPADGPTNSKAVGRYFLEEQGSGWRLCWVSVYEDCWWFVIDCSDLEGTSCVEPKKAVSKSLSLATSGENCAFPWLQLMCQTSFFV